jgi:predicted Zn-dependent protease
MTEIFTSLFEQGLERYKAGESAETLLPFFKDLCDRFPKHSEAWSSLAWLYLLSDKPNSALKAAQKSVKLDGKAPQSRINLALAMLDAGEKGVRPQVEMVQQMMSVESQIKDDLLENIEDGLARKPDWKSLIRIKNWLFE